MYDRNINHLLNFQKLCNLCRGQGRRRQRTKGTSGTISMVMSDCDGCNGTGKAPYVLRKYYYYTLVLFQM